jgi:hypothetical protein
MSQISHRFVEAEDLKAQALKTIELKDEESLDLKFGTLASFDFYFCSRLRVPTPTSFTFCNKKRLASLQTLDFTGGGERI